MLDYGLGMRDWGLGMRGWGLGMMGWGWGLGIWKSHLLPLWKRGKIKGGFVAAERRSAKLALCCYK